MLGNMAYRPPSSPSTSSMLVRRLCNFDLVGGSLFKFLAEQRDVPLGFEPNRDVEAEVSPNEPKSQIRKEAAYRSKLPTPIAVTFS
jgi:hypothetical protein